LSPRPTSASSPPKVSSKPDIISISAVMSDLKMEQLYKRTTPSFQKYQRESFWQRNESKTAPFNTCRSFRLNSPYSLFPSPRLDFPRYSSKGRSLTSHFSTGQTRRRSPQAAVQRWPLLRALQRRSLLDSLSQPTILLLTPYHLRAARRYQSPRHDDSALWS
jgi:hypothetical protein